MTRMSDEHVYAPRSSVFTQHSSLCDSRFFRPSQVQGALKRIAPDITEERNVQDIGRHAKLQYSRHSEGKEERVRVSGITCRRSVAFAPLNHVDYRVQCSLRVLFRATHFLECKDSVKYKLLSCAHRGYYQIQFNVFMNKLLEGPEYDGSP